MSKETKVICKNNFKNSNKEIIKVELNQKIAKVICRAENLTFKKG